MLAGLTWLGVGQALAQEPKPSSVLIARVAGDESIILRLRAELSSYRFRVVELPASPRRSALLSDLAVERDAQAALRAKPESMEIELWVRASGSGLRGQELVSAGPARNPEVLALRVTEAMRARGLALPQLAAAAPKPQEAADSRKRPRAADEEPSEIGPAEPTLPPTTAVPVSPVEKANDPEPEPAPSNAESPKAKLGASERKPPEPEPARPNAEAQKPKPTPERKPAEAEPESEPTVDRLAEKEAEASAGELARTAQEETSEAAQANGLTTREALVYAEVGPSGVWSPGAKRVGLALDALISLRFRPYQTSSISLVGLIPLLSSDVKTNDGASIEVRTYGIGGFGDLHMPLGHVELSAGIGGLALLSSVMALNNPMYRSDYPTTRLAALLGRVGASLVLTRDLRLSASLMAGLTVRELELQPAKTASADVDVDAETDTLATWGRPLLFGTLSIELALPWDR